VSGVAIATTLLAISALTVAGSGVSLALTRTVHRARRDAALATA
jgi:hypothetical protein